MIPDYDNLPADDEALANIEKLCRINGYDDEIFPMVQAYVFWIGRRAGWFNDSTQHEAINKARLHNLHRAQKYLKDGEL